jgi:hypothetical protein
MLFDFTGTIQHKISNENEKKNNQYITRDLGKRASLIESHCTSRHALFGNFLFYFLKAFSDASLKE